MEENYPSENKFKKIAIIAAVALCIMFINLVYIDKVILDGGFTKTKETVISTREVPVATSSSNLCSSDCLAKIDKLSEEIDSLKTSKTSATPAPARTQTITTSLPKEFYIPFGTGSTSASDWQDVPGLVAYIDSLSYQNITSVIFEVSMHIPSGNQTANVRLYNSTDGRAISGSELTFNGNSSSVLLNSGSLTLDYGKKLYKVQAKTQLSSPAIIDQSRVHITTK